MLNLHYLIQYVAFQCLLNMCCFYKFSKKELIFFHKGQVKKNRIKYLKKSGHFLRA